MIDLRAALNCIQTMKGNRTYRGEKIGRISSKFSGELLSYRAGQIVLFRKQLEPYSDLVEYRGIRKRPSGFLTVELPMSLEDIQKQKSQGSLLTTFGTMINVPSAYIEEIRV